MATQEATVKGWQRCRSSVSGPAFILAEQVNKVTKPLCEGCKFENPPKKGNYLPLVIGASCFGLGWGLIGLCPGPALVSIIPKIITGIVEPWQPDFGLSAAAVVICISWLVTDRVITTISARMAESNASSEAAPKVEENKVEEIKMAWP